MKRDEDAVLTFYEAQELLGLSHRVLREMCKRGEVPFFRTAGRKGKYMFSKSALLQLVAGGSPRE